MFIESFLNDETRVEKIADGVYMRETHEGWFGAVGLFGGYVNMIVLQALAAEVDDIERLPRYLGIQFLRPFPTGELRVETHTERKGSSVSVLSFRVFVREKLCGVGIGTFGKFRDTKERVNIVKPQHQSFDEAAKKSSDSHRMNCFRNFEIWIMDEKSAEEKSEIVAWARLASDKADPQDPLEILFCLAASDIVPPIIVKQENYEMHFMGTMDFTVHFRQPAAQLQGEPALVRIHTAASKEGYVDEDCEIFAPDGRLLLQSRQLRFIQKVSPEKMPYRFKEEIDKVNNG